MKPTPLIVLTLVIAGGALAKGEAQLRWERMNQIR